MSKVGKWESGKVLWINTFHHHILQQKGSHPCEPCMLAFMSLKHIVFIETRLGVGRICRRDLMTCIGTRYWSLRDGARRHNS